MVKALSSRLGRANPRASALSLDSASALLRSNRCQLYRKRPLLLLEFTFAGAVLTGIRLTGGGDLLAPPMVAELASAKEWILDARSLTGAPNLAHFRWQCISDLGRWLGPLRFAAFVQATC